jgi:hypothetical protein
VKAPAAIDFSAYKKKLKFTSSAVDALEVRCRTAVERTGTAALVRRLFAPPSPPPLSVLLLLVGVTR